MDQEGAQSGSGIKPGPKLADSIVEAGKRGFDPSKPVSPAKSSAAEEFRELIQKSPSWPLVQALNALIKPQVVPPWLRTELLRALVEFPLRPDGVRSTLEFVFSVHPSGASPASGTKGTEKKGASITPEAMALAARMISTPPENVSPETWFGAIKPQLFHLLDGDEGVELVKVAAHVICSGVLAKRQYGAPGTAGWNEFVSPLIRSINPSLGRIGGAGRSDADADGIVHLSTERTLVTSEQLSLSLRRLKALLLSAPYPAQCRRVLAPIHMSLWMLCSWPSSDPKLQDAYCSPAKSLLLAYLKLAAAKEKVMSLVRNLSANGIAREASVSWTFRSTEPSRLDIVSREDSPVLDLGSMAHRSTVLLDLMRRACSAEEVSSIFLDLFKEWQAHSAAATEVNISPRTQEGDPKEAAESLFKVVVLQKMLEALPDNLIGQFHQLIVLICQVLESRNNGRYTEEGLAVTLSLLSHILTSPGFQRSQLKDGEVQLIETSLDDLSQNGSDDIRNTAANLAMLWRYRDELEDNDSGSAALNEKQLEDRRSYQLALEYINDADSPPPVKAEGLNMLTDLVVAGNPAADIPSVLVILSALIRQDDDFINLRVVRAYTQVAGRHPKSVATELVERYVDSRETMSTDVRLRFGEALSQVIQRLGQTFAGDAASSTCEALVFIAGRRAARPKTEKKQLREERKQALKNKRAEEACEGEPPESEDDASDGDKEKQEIFAQIVHGWESKRGSEDVRIRTSAISILSEAINTNVGGIGQGVVSTAVDISINILTLEPELEKAILRRAAVVLVLCFVKALERAREEKRRLGFGLTEASRAEMKQVLQYIGATDNDGLVRQQASAVIESLENWQLGQLLTFDGGPSTLSSVRGLVMDPLQGARGQGQSARPRIEEVED